MFNFNQYSEKHFSEERNSFFLRTPESVKDVLAVLFGGYERLPFQMDTSSKTLGNYVLKFITKGTSILNAYGRNFKLSEGMIVGLLPETEYCIANQSDNSFEYIYLYFTGREGVRLFELCNFRRRIAFKIDDPEMVGSIFWRILRQGNNNTEYAQEVCSAYLKAIFLELAILPQIKDKQSSPSMMTFKLCKDYIDQNYNRIHSVKEVGDACCVTPQYITKLFLKYWTMPPHKYLMKVKLNTAADHLLTSTLSISQIASEVGFSDPFHFSNCFKKKHGLSPKQYRGKYMSVMR